MKALCVEKGELNLRNIEASKPDPGDAVLKVQLAGICATDTALLDGYKGFEGVLGHEFVGVVLEAAGADLVGKRVVADINVGCGTCEECGASPHHCSSRSVIGILNRPGAFAEHIAVPEKNLFVVPEELASEKSVFAEPLAAALRIVEQVSLDGSVCLVGDGKLGLLIALVLIEKGLRPTILGRHPDRLKKVLGDRFEPARSGSKYSTVIEATGRRDGFQEALSLAVPKGTLVLKSTLSEPVDLVPAVVNEVTVVGSRCGPIDQAIQLLSSGGIDPSPLIEAEYPLAEGLKAFEHARRRGSLKVLLRP